MLMSFRKGAAAFAAIATIFTTSAQAETHTVLIMEAAYFPFVTYVKQGDSIVFTNESGLPHTVTAEDGSWTTGIIADGGEYTVSIVNDMQSAFGGIALDDAAIEADLNFSEPPAN